MTKVIQVKSHIRIPLYGGVITVVISDEDNVYEAAKRNFGIDQESIKGNDAVTLARVRVSDVRVYPVVFSGQNTTPGLIAHEAKHLVNSIFLDIGIKADLHEDEAECYLLMWIVNRIWELKNKFDKKIKDNEEESRTHPFKSPYSRC